MASPGKRRETKQVLPTFVSVCRTSPDTEAAPEFSAHNSGPPVSPPQESSQPPFKEATGLQVKAWPQQAASEAPPAGIELENQEVVGEVGGKGCSFILITPQGGPFPNSFPQLRPGEGDSPSQQTRV